MIQLQCFASSRHTPGAGDNLASSAAAWEALCHVASWKADGDSLNHLQVIAAIWGVEEAGLRGARSRAANSSDCLLDLCSWNLNLDCVYDREDLFLLIRDLKISVDLSAGLVKHCQGLFAADSRDSRPNQSLS